MTQAIANFTENCRFCHIETEHIEFLNFQHLKRVGSDSLPISAGGRLACCSNCTTVHKPVDEKWKIEVKKIYDGYDIYRQGGGAESNVFPAGDGAGQTRSIRLCELLKTNLKLKEEGALLDIGCGSGLFLTAFGKMQGHWKMTGMEINTQYTSVVESIPNVTKMYTGSIDEIDGAFDIITLIHVFEHVVDLKEILSTIRKKLKPDGVLLIDSPDYSVNPFDLLIADHCNHFTFNTIKNVIDLSEYETIVLTNQWIQKEITLLTRPRTGARNHIIVPNVDRQQVLTIVQGQIDWLASVVRKANELRTKASFGTFGSSNAAGWLLESVDKKPDFLVDEDPARSGRSHIGVKIIHPNDVPKGSTILIPLSPVQAAQIQRRLSASCPDVQWVVP